MAIIYLTNKQVKDMENNILDDETGMTEFDYWEWNHPYDELVIVDEEKRECARCNKTVDKSDLWLTTDCRGIPFRYVCKECYDEVMESVGYDGEFYTELDENIDEDY